MKKKKALYIFIVLIGGLVLYFLLGFLFGLVPLELSLVGYPCISNTGSPLGFCDAIGTKATLFGTVIDTNTGYILKIIFSLLPILITLITEIVVIYKIIKSGEKKNSKKMGDAATKYK